MLLHWSSPPSRRCPQSWRGAEDVAGVKTTMTSAEIRARPGQRHAARRHRGRRRDRHHPLRAANDDAQGRRLRRRRRRRRRREKAPSERTRVPARGRQHPGLVRGQLLTASLPVLCWVHIAIDAPQPRGSGRPRRPSGRCGSAAASGTNRTTANSSSANHSQPMPASRPRPTRITGTNTRGGADHGPREEPLIARADEDAVEREHRAVQRLDDGDVHRAGTR